MFLHAHPDDETLATGVLLVDLVRRGHPVSVVTATRGEQGEARPGAVPGLDDEPDGRAALVAHRAGELAAALAELGVTEHAFLGEPPARAAGLAPRRYTDSGMTWLSETVAGPSGLAGPDSLTAADPAAAAVDLAAYLAWFGADWVVSYDRHGGYAHPDHVACHHLARLAAAELGIPLAEIVSGPLLPAPDAAQFQLRDHLPAVRRALGGYASQLAVEGDEVVHVGGQRQPIVTDVWLRLRPGDGS